MKQESVTDHHLVDLDVLCRRFNTDLNYGKTSEAADQDLMRDGANKLTPPAQTPEWVKFCKHMFGGFSLLLWSGAILCFTSYAIQIGSSDEPSKDNLYLGIVLSIVVITTVVVFVLIATTVVITTNRAAAKGRLAVQTLGADCLVCMFHVFNCSCPTFVSVASEDHRITL